MVAVEEGTTARKGAARPSVLDRSRGIALSAGVGGTHCCSCLFPGLPEARGAWRGPSRLTFQNHPLPAPPQVWGTPRESQPSPVVGLSHPTSFNFLLPSRPLCLRVQGPWPGSWPLGLAFSCDRPWALTPGLSVGRSGVLRPCSAGLCRLVVWPPPPSAVLFASAGRQVSVPCETLSVGHGAVSGPAGRRSGRTSCALICGVRLVSGGL